MIETRWSAYAEAFNSLSQCYDFIKTALEEVQDEETQTPEVKWKDLIQLVKPHNSRI